MPTPTGTSDATAAIQAALDSSNVVYFPNGTYLVSSTLEWPDRQTRRVFQGQSRDGVIIKLKDNCPGYSNPLSTKAVIWTGRNPAQRFQNYIRNLTVSTGTGNPGATGVQFMANNIGGMSDVLIKSEDGQGLYGLDLGYTDEQGPCLIKRVAIHGYDVGIRTKFNVDGVVMEHITLKNQNVKGISNNSQCLSIRGLTSENSVTVARKLWQRCGSSCRR